MAKASSQSQRLGDKTLFTTGEAATLCKVSQQTIIRCFDRGQLQGFRVPGSRFRRIPRESLIEFMREHEIDTSILDSCEKRVLLVTADDRLGKLVLDTMLSLGCEPDDLETVPSGLQAGVMLAQDRYGILICAESMQPSAAVEFCEYIKSCERLHHVQVVMVLGEGQSAAVVKVLKAGAARVLRHPLTQEQLAHELGAMLKS